MLPSASAQIRLLSIGKLSAVAAIGISVLVLTGWLCGISALTRLMPGYSPVTPIEAIAYIFAGTALFSAASSVFTARRRAISAISSAFVFAAGAITLREYVLVLGYWYDNASGEVLFLSDFYPGRMSPHSAIAFVFLGLALITLNRLPRLRQLSELLSIIVLAITFSAALGYLYSAQWLFGINNVNGMTPPEALVFFALAAGSLAANRESELVRLLISETLGGTIARRLMPLTVIVPTVLGWLRVVGQEADFFNSNSGLALMVMVSNLLMFGAIYYFARYLHTNDIQRRSAEKQLTESEERYRDLIGHSLGLICTHTPEGVITSANPAALAAIGCSPEELIGQNLRDLLEANYRPEFDAYIRKVVNEGMANGLMRIQTRTGRSLVWRYHNVLISEKNGEDYILGHATDVTELMDAQRKLRELSLTDEMTGLYNRRGFLTLAEQQLKLERHRETARGLALIFADMDGLKRINDTFGHDSGSEALVNLARILKSEIRAADIVARWGGDEFVILTIGSDGETADILVKRIRDAIDQFNADSGRNYRIECSFGVEQVTLDGSRTITQMITEADQAMYKDKRSRKIGREETRDTFPPNPPPNLPVSSPVIGLP